MIRIFVILSGPGLCSLALLALSNYLIGALPVPTVYMVLIFWAAGWWLFVGLTFLFATLFEDRMKRVEEVFLTPKREQQLYFLPIVKGMDVERTAEKLATQFNLPKEEVRETLLSVLRDRDVLESVIERMNSEKKDE